MGAPTTDNPDPINGALIELTSASSSLHMFPEAMSHDPDKNYLVDTDRWAHHAHEHITAAIAYLRKARSNADQT